MFQYHGWVTIRDSAGCEDRDEDPAQATLHAVRTAIADAQMEAAATLEARNISWFLTIMGHNNHRNAGVVELFEAVARLAPGSYGILYTHDDEANLWSFGDPYPDEVGESADRWYCRVMKRGRVERHEDAFLSPHIGVVEDDCSS
jgi:hypothetical protein